MTAESIPSDQAEQQKRKPRAERPPSYRTWREMSHEDRVARAAAMQGRPTKLTPEVEETIIRSLEGGQYLATAARLAGVAPATLYEWLRRGRGEDDERPPTEDLARFAQRVDKADAHAETSVAGNLMVLTRRSADAAFRFLAHRWRERWGDDAAPPPAPGAATINVGVQVNGAPRLRDDVSLAVLLEQRPAAIPETLAFIREVLPAIAAHSHQQEDDTDGD